MKFGYLPKRTLRELLDAASDEILNKDWLIVALDSARGDSLYKSYVFLKNRLPQTGRWIEPGIRFQGYDLVKADILVHFSAAFVLDPKAAEPAPVYNLTSESETFESALPPNLIDDFQTPGVLAYFADGCGLNYCCVDASLCEFLNKL
jgi:hypothetical protein